MALIVKDRVKETTATTGTGTVTLDGASTGFQSFSVIGDTNTTFYTLVSGSDWEVGVGTYTLSGTTLSRDLVLESSNAGSAITLAGTSDVFCTYPAERAVYKDSSDTGVAPQFAMASAVAMKVKPVVTTSSPGPISSAFNIRYRASVPEATPTPCATPMNSAISRSKAST